MPARRKSRQRALQVLFLWDLRKLTADEAIEAFRGSLYSSEADEDIEEAADRPMEDDPFMGRLVRGTTARVVELDSLISQRAENWRLERMPVVDRNILRMAIYEMQDLGTPPPVVIDEALELARRFTEVEALPFINGVLDAVRKSLFPNPG